MSRSRAIPHLLFLLLLSLLIYQPWAIVPFPMVDYSEFLGPLQQGGTFIQGLGNVIDYYRSHGRSSYLAYLQLALNWLAFGNNPVGWNVAVYAYMAAATAAVWFMLVRLGNSAIAATLAAAVLVVSSSAVPVWLRPTGEPLVLLFVAVSVMLALSYQRSERWRLRALVLLLLFLGIGLAKDLLTPMLLLPFAVACCWDGRMRKPVMNSRTVWLMVGTAIVTAALALSIWYALSQRGPDAYTEGYSQRNVSPAQLILIFWTTLLPYTRALNNQPIGVAHVLANIAYVLVLVSGIVVALRGHRREAHRAELNAWVALLLLGALLYSPLGWFSPFYAVPFALGSVALFARALSALESYVGSRRWLVRGVAVLVVLTGAVSAWNAARRETANRRIHGELARTIAAIPSVDSMVVAWPAVNQWVWAQQATIIRRYAISQGDLTDAAAPAGDALCGTIRPAAGWQKRILLVNYPSWCGNLPFPTSALHQSYLEFRPLPKRRQLRLELAIVGPDSLLLLPLKQDRMP